MAMLSQSRKDILPRSCRYPTSPQSMMMMTTTATIVTGEGLDRLNMEVVVPSSLLAFRSLRTSVVGIVTIKIHSPSRVATVLHAPLCVVEASTRRVREP